MLAALANKAYQLPLDPAGSCVFRDGSIEILSPFEEELSKKRQHPMGEAVSKTAEFI